MPTLNSFFSISRRSTSALSRLLLCALAATLFTGPALAQEKPESAPAAQSSQPVPAPNPDAQIVAGPPPTPKTPPELKAQAWTMLSAALSDPKHPDLRIQALAALGMLGSNPRSLKMIEDSFADRDIDVRTAAVLSAGQTHSPAITSALRRLLDDKEPQVAYASALSLWKMGDHSGEDILMSVVDGERRASATLLNGTEHTINKDLHSPSTLARIGVLQGAGLILGPFGFGITAYEYIHKNGGDSARVSAIDALAEEKTEPLRKEFMAALNDKDLGVRAAAAKALDSYHQPEVSAAIAVLFDDSKPPVRLTAASAYLISSGDSPASPNPNAKTTPSHRTH